MFLVIGEPKAGKSTFVNQIPDCLVIDTQSGHAKLGGCVLDLREAGADPLATFGEVLSQLQKDCPYQAVAIDTLDDLSVMAEELATQRCNVKLNMKETGVGQFPHGIGWVTHREIVMTMLTKIRALPCTTILVAHNKRMIDEETSEVSKVLDLPGKLAHWVPGEVDHIAIASRSKKKGYTLSFEGIDSEGTWSNLTAIPEHLSVGYIGHDTIERQSEMLVRTFPIYLEGNSNSAPTGGTRSLIWDFHNRRWRPDPRM
jgi:hypothetical protein